VLPAIPGARCDRHGAEGDKFRCEVFCWQEPDRTPVRPFCRRLVLAMRTLRA